MDVLKRVDELMKLRGWSDYRLAQEAGISQSTIANMRNRGSIPSVSTIELICDSLGITLADFFTDDIPNISAPEEEYRTLWVTLTNEQKHIVLELMREFQKR